VNEIEKQLESYRPPPLNQDGAVVNAVLVLAQQVGTLVSHLKSTPVIPPPAWRPALLAASGVGAAVGCFFALALLLMGAKVLVPAPTLSPDLVVQHEQP